MYTALLHTHSSIRFVILITLVLAIILAFIGWLGNNSYGKGNKVLNLITLISAHIQGVVGLILYFVSPYVQTAQMGTTMKDELLRYWTVEHLIMMLFALILITVGYSKHKKATESLTKHRTIAIFYTLALLTIVAAIIMSGRPLLAMSR